METIARVILDNMAKGFPIAGTILMALGTLVIAAQAYILATPGTDDDHWLAKVEDVPVLGTVLKVLTRFAVVQRSAPEVEVAKPQDPPPPAA